ncbi:MAG: VWA domain-containing protein [Actinomycetota bacterium]|nr:VWA domain-containing protein [Actinomycetota bacterium]
MPSRFNYSRWDGTQQGFDFDAQSLIDELADDLVHHGDVNAAMRKLMQDGMRNDRGEKLMGLREMMKKLREKKNEIKDRGDLGGVYKEIAEELDDLVDEERHAIDQALKDALKSGDERRSALAKDSAEQRNFRLDMLPEDLAGKINELEHYDFQSQEAQQRFEALLEKLRNQLMQQYLDQASSAVNEMTPESMKRTKDMMAALNEMINRREQGQDPEFEKFMENFGDFFPENPKNLDELLEIMAKRMADAQAMLNSMTPEQRDQMRQLSEKLLEDMDLRWQMSELAQKLQAMFPQQGWDSKQEFTGEDPMGFGEAMRSMQELGDLDQLDNLLRNASSPSALAEADLDRVSELLGEDVAKSLQRMSELTKKLKEAGLIDQTEGKLEMTPRGLRKIGEKALRDVFGALDKDRLGQHQVERIGVGHERTYDTKPYEYGDPFQLDLQQTLRNALKRQGSVVPVKLIAEDFEIEQTEHLTRSSTVLMLDLSLSMPMRDYFLPAKKVAMALHSLMSSQFPRDYLGIVGFSETARVLKPHQLPEVSWDFVYGTNMQHGFMLAREMLSRQSGTKQIIMITDGEPTAHISQSGDVFFNYPPVRETIEATLREVMRATREGIRINTFMLDASHALQSFIEQLTAINKGRAFFTGPENLGEYVLVDFIEHKRQLSRLGGVRRAG